MTNPDGIPAALVNGQPWHLRAGDASAGYDYFDSGSDGFHWITGSYFGGYHPGSGQFSGTVVSGFFQAASGNGISVLPRNGDGIFLAMASPSYVPPLIWSNGLTYRFLAWVNAYFDVYALSNGAGYVFVQADGTVSGLLEGSYQDELFDGPGEAIFAALADGTPLPHDAPHWIPPAVRVSGAAWRQPNFRNSTAFLAFLTPAWRWKP